MFTIYYSRDLCDWAFPATLFIFTSVLITVFHVVALNARFWWLAFFFHISSRVHSSFLKRLISLTETVMESRRNVIQDELVLI